MKISKCSLGSRLEKHFAGVSALAAAAGLAAPAQNADAGVVYSGPVSINIPTTTAGVYLNVVTGVNAPTPATVPGWDVNPWGSGGLYMFNPGAPAGGVYVVAGGVPTNVAPGTMIDGSSTYGSGLVNATFNLNSSNNIVGFRFQNEAAGNVTMYGWMRISLSGTTTAQPRTIVEYAYEDTGAGILAGDIGGTTGACCRTDGTCIQSTSAGCAAGGGVYRGDNTPCATANCPPAGACCRTGGLCSAVTNAGCAALGGVYRGDGTACASANCPGGFVQVCNIPGTFTDISATGVSIVSGDDATGPFTSTVTNALVTNGSLFACTNGFISDSSTFTTFTNTTLPTASATFGLFPNWDDLFVDAPGSLIHQAVVEGGVPVHIIQWNQVRTFAAGTTGPRGTFQVKIFGAGGPALVQYLYQSMAWDGNGDSSTVGVQWGASNFYQASFNTPGSIPDNSVCSIIASGGGSSCYANCDGSTTQPCLNVLDFGCFLNKFAANDTYANCDQSTTPPVLNVLDFGCFLNRFAAGCSSC